MQRTITALGVALLLQVGLASALALQGDRLSAAPPDTPLVAADLKTADRLLIDGPAPAQAGPGAHPGPVELLRRSGRWQLPGSDDAPADDAKVQALLDKLAKARHGLAVATSDDALKRFEVADDRYERRLTASAGGHELATVYLGRSPALHQADARTAKDHAVYAVDLATYDLPDDAKQWLDDNLLAHDLGALARIEVAAAGKPGLLLTHGAPAPAAGTAAAASATPAAPPADAPWQATGMVAGRHLDAAQAQALANGIQALKVDAVLGTRPPAGWRADAPDLRLVITDAAGHASTWILCKPAGSSTLVLKSSDHPWYLSLPSWSGQPLLSAAASLTGAGAAGRRS